MKTPDASPNRRADAAMVFLAMVWGTTFVLVKDALADVSTLLFLALRFSLATVMLALFFRGRMTTAAHFRKEFRAGALAGGMLFLGYYLQTAGLRLTTASKSAFITGLYIVLIPLFGAAVYKIAPRWIDVLGTLLALAGLGLLTIQPGSLRMNFGDLLTIACAVAFACHMLLVEYFSRRVRFESLGVMQIAAVALLSLASCFWAETPRVRWSANLWTALLVTSLFATAVAFALYSWAQRHTTATRAALLFTLEPVFAGLTGWLVAGETMTGRMLAGASLILAAIVLVELKPRLAGQHPTS
jgi:drug/metabolite transporter (DMT)-like permease